MTQNVICELFKSFGLEISEGQINNILLNTSKKLESEKIDILKSGLESNNIQVDDTGARHVGKNFYSTTICNDLFAYFNTTKNKKRITFLKTLQGNQDGFVINQEMIDYVKYHKISDDVLNLLKNSMNQSFLNQVEWDSFLKEYSIVSKETIRILTEGALIGCLMQNDLLRFLKIHSDDAGQFNVFIHSLCWVHACRAVEKIIPLNEAEALEKEKLLDLIWDYYKSLKEYKSNPLSDQVEILEANFNTIFNAEYDSPAIIKACKRFLDNKKELLMVLQYPEIPIQNNLSERNIRSFVLKRKISGATRTEEGLNAVDIFMTIKKTAQIWGYSFYNLLVSRLKKTDNVPYLPDLIRNKIKQPTFAGP